MKDGHAINFLDGLFSCLHAIVELRPAACVPFRAVHYREAAQAGIGVAAQDGGHWCFREFSVGALGKHAYAGGGTHEAIEGARIRSDFAGKLVGGLRAVFHEVWNGEVGEAGDSAGNADAIQ